MSITAHVAIHWFRRDLRLDDNLALTRSARAGERVVPAYIHPDLPESGSGTHAWLVHSLRALDESLRERGSRLVVRIGAPEAELIRLAVDCGARVVTCTRDWAPAAMVEEHATAVALAGAGIELHVVEGQLLVTPPEVATAAGDPMRVFGAYHRRWSALVGDVASHLAEPPALPPPPVWPSSAAPFSTLAGSPDLSRGCEPGERCGRDRLEEFATGAVSRYVEAHDRPDVDGTSRMSPHLAFGEVSPARVLTAVGGAGASDAVGAFVRQLAWREFSYHLLHHFPLSAVRPLRPGFLAMPWRSDDEMFERWCFGKTGYPLVDAGMRQMVISGWMHNRVRMVTASFLTKDLLMRWQDGERFFAKRLADYDPAVNPFNWQWVAGCGADAAPYFRIFNPVVQGRKFDPDGRYVREWVPELRKLPATWIHEPWKAPADVLEEAGVRLGTDYPLPMIDHAEARLRALAAFETVKRARG